MAKVNDYEPFSQRKKIPDFPSVYKTGWQGPTRPVPVGNFNTPFGPVSNAPQGSQGIQGQSGVAGTLPDMPPDNAAAAVAVPQFPTVPPPPDVAAGAVPLAPPLDGQGQGDHPDDAAHAGNVMSQLDDMMKMINSIGAPAEDAPIMDTTDPSKMSPVGSRPPDRSGSWMFQKRDGWDGPKTGSSNYTPAPVTFNNTGSSDWGTAALDQRNGGNGPAASTQRYYQRALDRAGGGSRADATRIRRLPLRINGRPTNG